MCRTGRSAHSIECADNPIPAVTRDLGRWPYAGDLQPRVRGMRKWGKLQLEIVRKPKDRHGFAVVPCRWIVERTFAWLGRHRRLKVDSECLPEPTEALIHIAMIRLMVRRLAPQ